MPTSHLRRAVRRSATVALVGMVGCARPTRPTPTVAPAEEDRTAAPARSPTSVAALCDEPPRAYAVIRDGRTIERAVRFCAGRTARGYALVHQLWPTDAQVPDHELWVFVGRSGRFKGAELRRSGIVGTERAPVTIDFRATKRGLERTLHGDRTIVAEPLPDGSSPWVLTRHAIGLRAWMIRLGVGAAAPGAPQVTYAPETGEVLEVSFEFESTATGVVARSPTATLHFVGDPRAGWDDLVLDRVDGPQGRTLYRAEPVEEAASVLPHVPEPTYTLPADLAVEPVRIDGEGAPTLAGEFVRRRDLRARRTCGAVFASGSGPQDRYGFVPGTSIDVGSHEITDAIARAGCIVLRFDDRGTGESQRGPKDVGYFDEVEDVRRAVATLARHPRVDPRRVVLVGHSLGGTTAILLGDEPVARGQRPAALVLMATTGRNLRSVIEDQVRALYADDPERLEAKLAETRRIHETIVRGETPPPNVAPAARWMREVFSVDPLAELRRVRAPVLVLQGGKDFQVHPERDFGPLRAAVEAPTPPPGRAVLFEGLDHLFKPEPGVSTVGHYGDLSRRVAPEVVETIVAFLRDEARVLPD